MADYLASIFGTEKDKVNCSFYFKIGACRHGEKCSKVHNKPTFSQTVLLKNLYINPLSTTVYSWDHKVIDPNNAEQVQKNFDDIFEELFLEMEHKYGEIEEMNICDNLSEHLAGNTYVKFRYEEDAEKACQDLNNRWFGGRPVWAELSPVTDFHEACCRQYQMGECPRGKKSIAFRSFSCKIYPTNTIILIYHWKDLNVLILNILPNSSNDH